MKIYSVSLATIALMIAAPAMAKDGETYVGVEAGWVHANDIQFDVTSLGGGEVDVNNKDGWEAGGVIGHDFGMIRLELEGAYKDFGVESVNARGTRIPTSTALGSAGLFTDIEGGNDVASGMLNGLLDFGGNDGIGFSIGAGIGYAIYDANFTANEAGPGIIIDKDEGLAYQGVAQLYFPLTQNVDFGVRYKYFVMPDLDLTSSQLRQYEDDFESHSVLATLTYNFGAPTPPPPPPAPPPPPVVRPAPPPPPPPPPPPAARQCNTGPYIVFFDWDKSDITAEAASVLNSAVTAYGDCGTAAIMLAGHADRSGSTQYNVGLSERRNAAVQSYLAGRGIPAARISSEAFGEGRNRVATADGVRELQNRRVEISYGPGSGR